MFGDLDCASKRVVRVCQHQLSFLFVLPSFLELFMSIIIFVRIVGSSFYSAVYSAVVAAYYVVLFISPSTIVLPSDGRSQCVDMCHL